MEFECELSMFHRILEELKHRHRRSVVFPNWIVNGL